MHTGDLLADLLAAYGLNVVFGVPGGQTCALYDAIARRDDIRHISLRDERSAAFAADAYARVSGKVGVCDVTVGPGAVKLPSGLLEAYNTSIPVLCLVSEVQSDWLHLYPRGTASQAMQQERLLDGLCAYVTTLRDPAQLPGVLRIALRHATATRPAPVAVIVPHEVFDQRIETDGGMEKPPQADRPLACFPNHRSAPANDDVKAAVRILAEARRPALVAGGGVIAAGAFDELARLAELLTIPVLTTLTGRGAMADAHPLSLGLVGNVGLRATRRTLEEADAVVLAGFKSAQNSTFNWTLPRSDQRVIHLDADATEIGKMFRTDAGLLGDAKLALELLADCAAAPSTGTARQRLLWIEGLKTARDAELHDGHDSDAVPILPQRLMAELSRLCGPDDIVTCDASYVSGWGTLHYPIHRAGRVVLTPRGSAGLGFALPAAIGAALARPHSRIIALAGDGGFSYSLPELAAAARYGLNIKCIVFNNNSLTWIEHWHRLLFEGASGEPFLLNPVDFAQVARGFACHAARVDQPTELATALQAALQTKGPAVVDVVTSRHATPLPTYADALSSPNSPLGYMG